MVPSDVFDSSMLRSPLDSRNDSLLGSHAVVALCEGCPADDSRIPYILFSCLLGLASIWQRTSVIACSDFLLCMVSQSWNCPVSLSLIVVPVLAVSSHTRIYTQCTGENGSQLWHLLRHPFNISCMPVVVFLEYSL